MIGNTSTTGVVPPREGDSGPPPLTAGQAISGPSGIVGLGGRRAKGLALRLAAPEGDGDDFEIAVLDEGDEVALVLGPYPDEEVVAVWRSLAGASGLPLLVQRPDGGVDAPYPQIGALRLGRTRMRRRHRLLAHRRPRFLTRRKPAAMPVRPLVFREPPLSSR